MLRHLPYDDTGLQCPICVALKVMASESITHQEQLDRWVAGDPVHRVFEMSYVDSDGSEVRRGPAAECTPDFACCKPNLLASVEIRRAFAAGSESLRCALLRAFLNAMMQDEFGDRAPRIAVLGDGDTCVS